MNISDARPYSTVQQALCNNYTGKMKNTNKSKRITKDHDTVYAFVYKKYRGHPLPLECPSTSNNSSYQSTSFLMGKAVECA